MQVIWTVLVHFSMAKVLQEYKMMTVITKTTTPEQWKEAVGSGLRLQSVAVCTGTIKCLMMKQKIILVCNEY